MQAILSNDLYRKGSKRINLGMIVISLLIFGFGGWTYFATIEGAVIISGSFVVENNRKNIEHREGGIIEAIKIYDGQFVDEGDELIILRGTKEKSQMEALQAEYKRLTLLKKRLHAQRNEANHFEISHNNQLDDDYLIESKIFDYNREKLALQKQQVDSRVNQIDEQLRGLTAQLAANQTLYDLSQVQHDRLSKLEAKNLVESSKILESKQKLTQLSAQNGQLVAQRAELEEKKIELNQGWTETFTNNRNEILTKIVEVNSKIESVRSQIEIIQDKLERLVIRAPEAGQIFELSVHTIGSVINPSEKLMSLVPLAAPLIIEGRLDPVNVNHIYYGQSARIKLPSFNQRTTPDLMAKVISRSGDLSKDPSTGQQYYLVRLQLEANEFFKLEGQKLVAGMPAEIFINTEERTVLENLTRPLTEQFAHAMREP